MKKNDFKFKWLCHQAIIGQRHQPSLLRSYGWASHAKPYPSEAAKAVPLKPLGEGGLSQHDSISSAFYQSSHPHCISP